MITLIKWLFAKLFRRTRTADLPLGLHEPKRQARLLYITRLFQKLEGHSVRFVRDVARFPHFRVMKGQTGRIVGSRFDPADWKLVLRVELDDAVAGALEFGNEVHWKEDVNLEDFEKDVVLLVN